MEGSSIQIDAPNDNIEKLQTWMMKELNSVSPMSPSRCIFRVPHRLRCQCAEAYTPQVISIGPLHHGKKTLKAMEEHKIRYLKYFLGRQNNLSLKDYIKRIKYQEDRLRSCYSETIELKSDQFVRIILVDAIFVIEFLIRWFWHPELVDENDCIFGKPRMEEDVWRDLMMIENQLPFFILECLYDRNIFLDRSTYGVDRPILYLSRKFLGNSPILARTSSDNFETTFSSELGEVQHFVDLLRQLGVVPMRQKVKKQSAAQTKLTRAPSIEELHMAGVKFEVGSTKNLFDIQFKDGVLKIPKLNTDDSTELILGNLIAFEQCTFDEKDYISDYICIMDMFVDTPKDVELLVKHGIVENDLGGGHNEVSIMINNISTGVLYGREGFYYGDLCEDLNNFCNFKWHKWMANLRQNYFNTPWATISFVAALLLLILTVIQTICAIIN